MSGDFKVCKDCKNFDDFGFNCVRGERQVGVDIVHGWPVHKYTVLRRAADERGSILPWRCGTKGRHFESKVQP
jgi:hypothetical protein